MAQRTARRPPTAPEPRCLRRCRIHTAGLLEHDPVDEYRMPVSPLLPCSASAAPAFSRPAPRRVDLALADSTVMLPGAAVLTYRRAG